MHLIYSDFSHHLSKQQLALNMNPNKDAYMYCFSCAQQQKSIGRSRHLFSVTQTPKVLDLDAEKVPNGGLQLFSFDSNRDDSVARLLLTKYATQKRRDRLKETRSAVQGN